MTNEEKKLHRDCEEHTAENCDINDHDNLDPALDDCGHTVPNGPAFDEKLNKENVYADNYGKHAIVADAIPNPNKK